MISKLAATGILILCDLRAPFPDFHTLDSQKVAALVDRAHLHRYRKPKNANGSRARYFYSYLVRRAESANV